LPAELEIEFTMHRCQHAPKGLISRNSRSPSIFLLFSHCFLPSNRVVNFLPHAFARTAIKSLSVPYFVSGS